MKALVVYYSLMGNTKFVAKELAAAIGAEYHKTNEVALDLSGYDLVAVGTPIWAHKTSWPVKNFLKRYDLTGKKVALFCTGSGGGGEDTTLAEMESLTSGKVISKKLFDAPKKDEEKAAQEVKEWAKTLGIPKTTTPKTTTTKTTSPKTTTAKKTTTQKSK